MGENLTKDPVEEKAEKIADELKVSLPASGSPLLLRLIALFTLIGGLSIIGSLFADIVRPPSNTPHFYFLRIVVGLLAIFIAYEIIEKSRLALWLYGVIVIIGFFINPIVSILPGLVFVYLVFQRRILKPSKPDQLLLNFLGKIRGQVYATKNLPRLLTSVIGCALVGIAATLFTISAIPTWYVTLNKPFFSPPNWVFGPVWTALYFLMGISAYMIWVKGLKKKGIKKALGFFSVQLLFNFLWSMLFFGLHSPILGLIDIVILWILVLITIIKFYRLSKIAAYLLIPYLLWVGFAAILNLSIVLLNP